jgi:tetratricopeptide (TPR) repeat protein
VPCTKGNVRPQSIAAFFPFRLRPALVVAMVLMSLWVVAYWQVSRTSMHLVQLSRSGPRALVLYFAGRYRDAGRAYRAGQRGPITVDYANDPAGFWAFRAGHLDEAEQRAKTTLDLVPSAVEPLVTLGEIAIERGDPQAAVNLLTTVLQRWPDHVDALYVGAVAMARAGEPDRAIRALNRGLRSNSAGTRDTILFHIMELSGELQERPTDQRPLCLLAHLHRYLRIFDARQSDIAMRYAHEAIAARDQPADAYLTLGIVLDKQGEYAAARRAMLHAIQEDPYHAEALRWLAVEAGKIGDLLLEYQMIKAAFEAAPTDPYYLDHLERVVVKKLGDPLGMAALLQRAGNRTNADVHARPARSALLLGDRAAVHSQKAAELRASSAQGNTP